MNTEQMPVITLWQPWASWVAEGWKTIETRNHNKFACLAGQKILIHAGMQWDKRAIILAWKYMDEMQKVKTAEFTGIRGMIICSAWIDGHILCEEQDEKRTLIECRSVERYGLFLSHIEKIEPPIIIKGKQGIWYFDKDINNAR